MKRLFYLIFFGILLIACQKEVTFEMNGLDNPDNGDTPTNKSYYIRCMIDGTAREFNYNTRATIVPYGSSQSLSLIGSATPNTSNFEGINLGINFEKTYPRTGTYHEDYQGSEYTVSGVYNPNSMTFVYGAGIYDSTANPLTITITAVSNKAMTGTFQGAFYKQDLLNGGTVTTEYKNITEGQFNLPIK